MWPFEGIIKAVADARLYSDSKTLVDRPLVHSLGTTQNAFKELLRKHQDKPSKDALCNFIKDYTLEAGSDLEVHVPEDWTAKGPTWLPRVGPGPVREWAMELNEMWKQLSRKTSGSVKENPDQHSLIHLPHPMIIVGDRFREVYYWDSYWILKGLLVCGMKQSAIYQVSNLLEMVRQLGHVPNGNRVYYTNRSQPPLLSGMVRMVWECGGASKDFLKDAVGLLKVEHDYWTSGEHAVCVQGSGGRQHCLSRYWAYWEQPRPESYREDVETAGMSNGGVFSHVYRDLASAAESGWDFSSRWLKGGHSLSNVQTTKVVPVDLNSFLFQLETNIAEFSNYLGDVGSSAKFTELARQRQAAIDDVLWDAETFQWRDFVLGEKIGDVWTGCKQTDGEYASNWFPLWCGVRPGNDCGVDKVVKSLMESSLIMPGGVATSNRDTGQQWDFPNAWPPIQCILIEGLEKCGESGRQLASKLAHKWLHSNYQAFKSTGLMHEKYDARETGGIGGGGEYAPQIGFGWSNGVALWLLERYGFEPDE